VTAADVVVVTVAWPQFRDLSTLIATLPRRRRVIVDCWRIIDRAQLEPITQVIYVGADRTTERAVAASRSEP
jgi:predicted dinucleotide-binding enzyme